MANPSITYTPSAMTFTIGQTGILVPPATYSPGSAPEFASLNSIYVTPTLPTGMIIGSPGSPNPGLISGSINVGAIPGTQNYKVGFTGLNGSGNPVNYETPILFSITIVGPPTSITYSPGTINGVQNTPITSVTPSYSGGQPTNWAVTAGALPAGILLDPATGTLSGTATVTGSFTATITGSNPAGSQSFVVNFNLAPAAPTGLSYTTPVVYIRGTVITPSNPTVTGTVTSYSVIGTALPAGLSLNSSTGQITGTPTVRSIATNYTIRASNVTGFVDAILNMTVNPPAPISLDYTTPTAIYAISYSISPNTPIVTGGEVDAYSISSGTLPTGLSLDPITGIITGTPTSVTGTPVSVTILGTNPSGSVSRILSIDVQAIPPKPEIGYTPSVAGYLIGQTVSLTPVSTGGPITSWAISPALTSGLTFNTTTGEITGTVTGTFGPTTFTVTATGPGGVDTFNLVLTGEPNYVPSCFRFRGTGGILL